MRTLVRLLPIAAILAAWSPPALAQVSDAERAAARDLFVQGDELQRAGKYAEALDKFQRAQQVYGAPTNLLHIAECQANVGRLVESAESYRSLVRTTLPPSAPPAFQAAIEQARGELAKLEPRVPKLLLQVTGAPANAQIQIDGQNVSTALLGEPIPLDPGVHQLRVSAPGSSTVEQEAVLKERETTPVGIVLRANTSPVGASPPLPPPPPAPVSAPAPALPPRAPAAATGESRGGAPPQYGEPEPPAAAGDRRVVVLPRPSRTGLLLGAHLGWELASGKFPLEDGSTVDAGTVASAGLAYAADIGLRFARQFAMSVTIEHASFSHGDLSSLDGVTDANASTTLFAGTLGFIGNPDRTSFYGEIGAGMRWVSVSETVVNTQTTTSLNAGEVTLGVGVWIPVGPSLRLVPKLTATLGSFNSPDGSASSGTQGHSFAMLGIAGFYNLDL